MFKLIKKLRLMAGCNTGLHHLAKYRLQRAGGPLMTAYEQLPCFILGHRSLFEDICTSPIIFEYCRKEREIGV
jgi:hypothetical protein